MTDSRWLQDDAVSLQLQEVRGYLAMLDESDDPARLRGWFVALCLFRADKAVKARLQASLAAAQQAQRGKPSYVWLLSMMADIERSPESYPFSLSEREFAYHSTLNFGGKIQDLEGIYHPPNFYKALAQDTVGIGLGVVAAAALPMLIPEAAGAAALSLPGLATASGRAAAGALIGGGASKLMPGGSWDAAKKSMLWPRYLADYHRRSLK